MCGARRPILVAHCNALGHSSLAIDTAWVWQTMCMPGACQPVYRQCVYCGCNERNANASTRTKTFMVFTDFCCPKIVLAVRVARLCVTPRQQPGPGTTQGISFTADRLHHRVL